MWPMDPAVAALIGAGTGAVVAVASQFIGHRLSLERDRRNQRRQRLTEAVVEAGSLLYRPDKRPPNKDTYYLNLNPESVAAQDPELHRMLTPMREAIGRGMVVLQVHLGHRHQLIDEYVETAILIDEAETAWHKRNREPQSVEDIRPTADAMEKAQHARDAWMRSARLEVERI
jgi:hypothetical protein